jgi:MinD-like ATPase involved in chromosome partitioning or flagellar assembly
VPGVLVLLGPSPWEGPLVAGLAHPACPVSIVRRCLDTADLVASAAAGLAGVALVGADAPRLDSDVVARVRSAGCAVIGVAAADDEDGAERLVRLGATGVVRLDPAELGAAVRGIARAVAAVEEPGPAPEPEARSSAPGRLVAVWGPPGAPGRTSTALAIADEAARRGVRTLLVDADTWAPSVPVVLGLVDDGAGLSSACRRALGGSLDVAALAVLAREVRPDLLVLPGIARAGRWPEVRASALVEVLDVARRLADLVVVDCAAPIEQDEELVFDTDAPRRNAAALISLETADEVVVVGGCEPHALVRLVGALDELRDAVPGAHVRVVVSRLREGAVGRRPAAAVADALLRHAGVTDVTTVPDDRAAYDAALREGRTLAEVAPRSAARSALGGLAAELLRDLALDRGRAAAG